MVSITLAGNGVSVDYLETQLAFIEPVPTRDGSASLSHGLVSVCPLDDPSVVLEVLVKTRVVNFIETVQLYRCCMWASGEVRPDKVLGRW